MGLGGLIIGAVLVGNCTGCCGVKTLEDTGDPNYNFFKKQNDIKDGLEVYKVIDYMDYIGLNQLRCPLCKYLLPSEEKKIIKEKLDKGEYKLLIIAQEYNRKTKTFNKIDIFDELDKIYKRFEEIKINIEEYRYYKHTCKNNKQCNREKDQDIYLDLLSKEIDFNYDNFLLYEHQRLKTDQNYKNKILSERKDKYEAEMKEKKKIEIERTYLPQFENYTLQKEIVAYNQAIESVEFRYKGDHPEPGSYAYQTANPSARFCWLGVENYCVYSGNKKKIIQYIERLYGESIDFTPGMSDSEYEEFQQFIEEVNSEYSSLL